MGSGAAGVAESVGSTGSFLALTSRRPWWRPVVGLQTTPVSHVDVQVMDAQDPDLPTAHLDMIASSLCCSSCPSRRAHSPLGRVRSPPAVVSPSRRSRWDLVGTSSTPPSTRGCRLGSSSRRSRRRRAVRADERVDALFSWARLTSVRTAKADIAVVHRGLPLGGLHLVNGSTNVVAFSPRGIEPMCSRAAGSRSEQIAEADGAVRLSVGVRYTLGQPPAQAVDAAN